MGNNSLNYKYHIVFASKYRRQVIYRKNEKDIGKILRSLYKYKGLKITEANVCKDYIHMLASIPV